MALFDEALFNDPDRLAQLQMGIGLLGGSGRTGGTIADALGGAVNSYQASAMQKQKAAMEAEKLRMLKLQEMRAQTEFDNQQAFIKKYMNRGAGQQQAPDLSQAFAAPGQAGPTNDRAALIPPAQQATAGGEGSDLDMLRAAALSGVKGAKELFDIHKYENEPREYKQGSTYIDRRTQQERTMPKLDNGFMMNGGVASLIPGYAEEAARQAGLTSSAQEAAKARFSLLPPSYVAKGADGQDRPIGGSVMEYLNPQTSMSGAAPQQAPRAPTGNTPPNWQGINADSRAGQPQRNSDMLKILMDEYNAETDPANKAAIGREIFRARNQPQAGVAAPQEPLQQIAAGRPLLQSEAEKKQQLGQIDIKQGAVSDLNKNWVTTSYNPVVEAGRTAAATTASLDALKNIDLTTGWGTEAKANAANVLTSLGIAPKNAEMFATNAQKFQSVAMDRLLTTLMAQKGPQTEGDSTRAQQTFAQLKNTPQANQFIADFARAKANSDARKAQFYQEALPIAQQTGDLNEIDRRWMKLQGSIWDDPVLQPYKRGK